MNPNNLPGVQLRRRSNRYPVDFPAITTKRALKYAANFFDKAAADIVTEIETRTTKGAGRPRAMTVRGLLILWLAMAILGPDMHITRVARHLRAMSVKKRRRLGLRYDDTGKPVTYRQVFYLLGAIASAYDGGKHPHNHAFYSTAASLVVDPHTGVATELRDFDAVYPEATSPLSCHPGCDRYYTVERLGNRLLQRLWEHLGIPETTDFALDSYVAITHYGARSWGALDDLDPNSTDERLRQDHPQRDTRKSLGSAARITPEQRRYIATARADYDQAPHLHEEPRDPRSRKRPRYGPTAPGDYTRKHPDYPQIGPDHRLRHTVDDEASQGFRGAGRSRRSSIENGRDDHVLVACGHFPDGSAIPPWIRAYAIEPAGSGRDDPALRALAYLHFSNPFARLTLRIDRGYTLTDSPGALYAYEYLNTDTVIDIRKDQRGAKPFQRGVILIDGYFFTAGMPKELHDLPRWERNETKAERLAKHKRFDRRAKYAFQQNAVLPSGKIQFRGPCYLSEPEWDHRGELLDCRWERITARCPNQDFFHAIPRDRRPLTTCKPGDDCLCGRTFTVRPEDLPGIYEPLIWGTNKWADAYYRRNLVESYNSFAQYHRGVGKHSIRVLGNQWNVLHMFAVLGNLLVSFHNWIARIGAPSDGSIDPLHPDVLAACIARVMTPPRTRRTRDKPPRAA